MLSSLWKGSSREDEERLIRYEENLKQLVSYFPIGGKTHYYPEYLEDIKLQTLILGYEINGIQIYGRDQVRQLSSGALEFLLGKQGETVAATDLNNFALIVPDTSELEKTLDYDSKAAIGKSGQFMRGNSITLVSTPTDIGTPIIDTAVLRRTLVKEGNFQNYKVVVLDPKLDSLTYKERRPKKRIKLSVACTLLSPVDNPSVQSGTLMDCSELCVGIELTEPLLENSVLAKGIPARLDVPMPLLDRTFELMGEVHAVRSNGAVVLKLQRIKKDDQFEDLQLVDRLELRASLAQLSQGT